MPRYDYECTSCSTREERVFSMSSMPASVECPECGADAVRVIDSAPESYVANREFVFDKAKCVQGFGKDYGRTDRQQHEGYQRYIKGMHDLKRQAASSKKGEKIEWLGTMPGEMADGIGMHEGDSEAFQKDPVTYLKKTGLYAGD